MEYYNFMSYSMQATPYFNQKIPLTRIAQSGAFYESKSKEFGQTNRNHITWEDTAMNKPQQRPLQKSNKSSNKSQRRRIFDKFQSRLDEPPRKKSESRSKQKQESKLVKVKSNPIVSFQQIQQDVSPDLRIQQINRQLKEHRLNVTSSRVAPYDQTIRISKQEALNLAKIEQKLSQSKEILRRQEEMLATKMPTFEKKIEDNNAAISEVTRLIKSKLENQSKKMDDLYLMMEKNGQRIRTREEELSRINSQLLQKESQIMRNKQINKRRELQLKRIKRIEDLQNKNLEIYQQIQKKDPFSRLQDVPLEGEGEAEEQCWGECESGQKFSKMSANKISTIQYSEGKGNSFDGNDTIGELLSPLALIQQEYLI